MQPKPTDKTDRFSLRLIRLVALFSVSLLLLLGAPAYSQDSQISLNLLQSTPTDKTTRTATEYFKKLTEQRSAQRMIVNIHEMPTLEEFSKDNGALNLKINMLAGKDQLLHLNKPGWTQLLLVSDRQQIYYQVLIDNDFWDKIPAELKIILTGALQDTKVYLKELCITRTSGK